MVELQPIVATNSEPIRSWAQLSFKQRIRFLQARTYEAVNISGNVLSFHCSITLFKNFGVILKFSLSLFTYLMNPQHSVKVSQINLFFLNPLNYFRSNFPLFSLNNYNRL